MRDAFEYGSARRLEKNDKRQSLVSAAESLEKRFFIIFIILYSIFFECIVRAFVCSLSRAITLCSALVSGRRSRLVLYARDLSPT